METVFAISTFIEAAFKAVGRTMRRACELDPRVQGIPSTKGSL